jgi:hypothetical protein
VAKNHSESRNLSNEHVFVYIKRRKFVNMSAGSVALWGHMALGIPPQKLRAWRLNVARTNKWIKGRGSLEVAMQINATPLDDPYFRVRLEQLKLWLELVRRCGVLASSALAKAWEQSWKELLGVSHRWKIVKGPLAATQAVLMDVGWTACQLDSWMDDLGFAWHIDASDPCLLARIELGFIASLKRRQCVLMSQQFFGQGLESGLDVVLHKRLLDSGSGRAVVADLVARGFTTLLQLAAVCLSDL